METVPRAYQDSVTAKHQRGAGEGEMHRDTCLKSRKPWEERNATKIGQLHSDLLQKLYSRCRYYGRQHPPSDRSDNFRVLSVRSPCRQDDTFPASPIVKDCASFEILFFLFFFLLIFQPENSRRVDIYLLVLSNITHIYILLYHVVLSTSTF